MANREAERPAPGTLWVWEPDRPTAAALIQVIRCHWNGEQWWVQHCAPHEHALPVTLPRTTSYWNELDRFWEAAHAVHRGNGPRSKRTRKGPPRPDEWDEDLQG